MSFRDKKGLATVSAIFMLLIVLSALVIAVEVYSDSDQSTKDQMSIEQARAQEKAVLTHLAVDNETNLVENVTVRNIGTIELNIRALYVKEGQATFFATDPANPPINADTHIMPGGSKVIDVSVLNLILNDSTRLIVATERGTRSLDDPPVVIRQTTISYIPEDTSLLYIGPLILNFTSFEYHLTNSAGGLIPSENWRSGWAVPRNTYIAWRISVKNNDTQGRDITLDQYASFSIANVDGNPQVTPTWFLKSTNNNQLLIYGQDSSIIFTWDLPAGSTAQKTYANSNTCMAFLTLFGTYTYPNGTTSSYGQTIPFEASIVVT